MAIYYCVPSTPLHHVGMLPEEGVIDASGVPSGVPIGVAMMLLGLRAASCCICKEATVATGDKYADWATRACCWTN